MTRKEAREHSFCILFSTFFQKENAEKLIERYFESTAKDVKAQEKDLAFIQNEVTGTMAHQKTIDERISRALVDWKLERLSTTDLAILRLCAYEMEFDPNIPISVSINEAVELAKRYSSDAAPAFINGVLGTVAQEIEALTKEPSDGASGL